MALYKSVYYYYYNVAPPFLCRKAAIDNLLQTIETHPNWPVYADVFEQPPPRLASRRPLWSDVTSVDTTTQWREDWSSAIVTDRQPGFDLPRHTCPFVNRFRTGHCPCRANLHKWGLAQSPSCDCGQRQTMNHIVDTCPWSGWWRSHMAGIYSDCSSCEIKNYTITKVGHRFPCFVRSYIVSCPQFRLTWTVSNYGLLCQCYFSYGFSVTVSVTVM